MIADCPVCDEERSVEYDLHPLDPLWGRTCRCSECGARFAVEEDGEARDDGSLWDCSVPGKRIDHPVWRRELE